MPLDAGAARSSLQRLGAELGLSAAAVARGIVQVVESGVENAIRSLVAGKGLTFPAFSLLVFGGAGGLHACGLARRLGIRRIVVPLDPGAFSALGLAISPAVWEASRTVLLKAKVFTNRELDHLTREMIRNGKSEVERSGAFRSGLRVIREADLRYEGQSHELTLPFGPDLAGRFHRSHEAAFGYARGGEALELVTVRVRIESPAPPFNWTRSGRRRVSSREKRQPSGITRALAHEAPCVPRQSLPEGKQIPGPLVVEEYSATTYVAAGFLLSVGPAGELVLEARS